MNNILEGINRRITEAEGELSDLEDRMVEITGTEQSIEKRMIKTEDSIRDLCHNIKCTNIRIIRVSEGGEQDPRKSVKR